MKIMEEELMIPFQDGQMYGILYKPEKCQEKVPLAIVSHGFYASHEMMRDTARSLTENGVAAYCFDYRGCSYSRKSGGNTQDCSVLTEIAELSSIIAYFKNSGVADSGKIFLVGQSMGGVVSALTAAERQDDICGLLLMCPAMNMQDTARQLFGEESAVPDVLENYMGIPDLNLAGEFFRVLFRLDFSTMFRFKKPVALFHGTEDEMVPITYSEKMAQEYEAIVFEKVSGAKHNFSLNGEQAKRAADFIMGH